MDFTSANVWQEFKTASRTEQGSLDDSGNEVVMGPRLNEAVRHYANGYLKRLELGPENKATEERAKILDLGWGRVEHDGALLAGLGAAMTSLAGTLGENVAKLAERWQGESYDTFTAAMAKIQGTLSQYGQAATTTGEVLTEAMGQARTLYQTFADESVNTHLNFGDTSPPEFWHKIVDWNDKYSGKELADCCPSNHESGVGDVNSDCLKNNDEQRNMITGHWVSERRWEICKRDGCEESLDRVSIMYTNLTTECDAAVERIKGKLDNYFGAVNTVVDGVSGLYDVALGNVYTLANAEVFSSLRVIGGSGGGEPAGGDPGSGDTGYPGGGGGDAAGPAGVAEPMQPPPEPEVPVEDTAPATAPAAVAQEPPAPEQESVRIQDGDRTISVTSPDGEGHVRVTVEDGAGQTKSYELDFDAASGLTPRPPADGAVGPQDADAPQQVPARTDGKCVIEDGLLTIMAERPLFSPDTITLTVADGTGAPTTYTLDFEDQATGGGDQQEPAPSATATTTEDVAGASSDAATNEPAAASPGPAATSDPVTQAGGHPTSPQAWQSDQAGSVSGVLVPEQQDGEAGLASAPDAAQPKQDDETDSSGMAGAGLPMMGTPGGPGSDSGGRAGSGWSVHGDLFDSGEPVYSMHGVLGDDDRTTE
jgi:uncharacterized protein YukE